MKKLKIALAAMTLTMFLGACGTTEPPAGPDEPTAETPAEAPAETPAEEAPPVETPMGSEEDPETSDLTVEDLFPFEADVYKAYEGEGNEYAWYDQYVDFIDGDRIQLRENNGGTEMVRVLEKKDGVLREVLVVPETYFKENFLSKESNVDRILLQEPFTLGATWINDNETSTISSLEKEVVTPYGTFTALEVTREVSNGEGEYTNIDYYAEGMGLVKTINIGDGYEITSSLEKMETGVPHKEVVNFYYPNANDERIFLYRKELSFTTNDIPRIKILDAYKELPKEAAPVLSENTEVNYLYLNQDGMVYVDLSEEFINEMNAGAGYESLILQSLANTFGDYYGADKVILTIEGETYESGHIALREFEPLEVNYDSIVDMN